MKNFFIGSIFFLIFSILFSVKYISVSILLSKSDSINVDLIKDTFKVLPFELTLLYSIAFLLGILYFFLGIKEYRRN